MTKLINHNKIIIKKNNISVKFQSGRYSPCEKPPFRIEMSLEMALLYLNIGSDNICSTPKDAVQYPIIINNSQVYRYKTEGH